MKCQYRYKYNPGKQCPHEAVEGSQYCIFHEKREFKDLRGKNLEKMDLEEAYLVKAKLDNAKLVNAILVNANFEGASLTNADLSWADLRGAILKDTNIENADLFEADLSEANLEGVNLRNSDMSGIRAKRVILRNSMLANSDMSYADLEDADLAVSDLSECNFFSANLQGANLKKCRLVNTTFREAHLENADLENCKAINTDFSEANLTNANLKEINAANADFSRATLINADLSKATLRGSDFSYAQLTGADLSYATLEGAIFHETNVKNTEFKNADVRYGRKWEYAKNLVPLKNEEKGREHFKKGEWKNAFREFCYASKIYNDLSYYFKERGIGRKEDEFLIKKWEMNELACRAFLRLNPEELTEEDENLLEEVLSLSGDSTFLKPKIMLKTVYYNVLKRGILLDFTKVLGASVGVILLFSFIYWIINTKAIKATPPLSFEEALYSSIVAFTTFGYENYYLNLHAILRYLASLEALLGMVLLSLFVVTLYRKIVR